MSSYSFSEKHLCMTRNVFYNVYMFDEENQMKDMYKRIGFRLIEKKWKESVNI